MNVKTSQKTGILSFNGKPIVDLESPIEFEVTESQTVEGARRNGEMCPGALGLKATSHYRGKKCAKVEVHRSVVYLDFGDKYALRGGLSSPLRREVISQDKGGKFDAGKYTIVPVSHHERKRRGKAHTERPSNHARPYKTKRAKPRLIEGIRKLALSSKNVGRI